MEAKKKFDKKLSTATRTYNVDDDVVDTETYHNCSSSSSSTMDTNSNSAIWWSTQHDKKAETYEQQMKGTERRGWWVCISSTS